MTEIQRASFDTHQDVVQRLFELAPDYTRRVEGHSPQPDEAEKMFTALAPGKTVEDKYIYVFNHENESIGLADLIRGYPSQNIAWIGLLLFSEAQQGKGFGKDSYSKLEKTIAAWPEIEKIRLSVVMTNAKAIPFWLKQGFAQFGELRPYKSGNTETQLMVMEKALGAHDGLPEGSSSA